MEWETQRCERRRGWKLSGVPERLVGAGLAPEGMRSGARKGRSFRHEPSETFVLGYGRGYLRPWDLLYSLQLSLTQ